MTSGWDLRPAALAVLAAVALAAIPAPARAADAYEIPVIQSLTGYGAFLGKNEHQALQLEEKVLNASGGIHGKPIRFVYHDDQSNPQVAVQLANEIIAGHPAVLLGSSLTATCSAMAPLMQAGPVMYCFSPAIHPAAGSYVFTSGVSTLDLNRALLNYVRQRGWTRIAVLTSTDASGQDGGRAFAANLARPENAGLTIVERVYFNTTDVSVAAQIERVKTARPDVFMPWSTGTPIATVFRDMIQAQLAVPVATTNGNMTYAQMKQYAEFLPKELYMPSAEWVVGSNPGLAFNAEVAARQKDFYAAYAAIGAAPDEASMHPWDPALLVVEALRSLPDGAGASQLRDRLLKLAGQAGINGVYDFPKTPQRGLALDDAVVTRWTAAAHRWTVVSAPTGIPAKGR